MPATLLPPLSTHTHTQTHPPTPPLLPADVRVAAASALAEGVEEHPGVVGQALGGALDLYESPAADDGLSARAGAAAALRALAPSLAADQLPATLDFLLSKGLADGHAAIREAMIAAGARADDWLPSESWLRSAAACALRAPAPLPHGRQAWSARPPN